MSVELKSKIIRLLKEDEEFCYAVEGLIGLDEILKAIHSLQQQVAENTKATQFLQQMPMLSSSLLSVLIALLSDKLFSNSLTTPPNNNTVLILLLKSSAIFLAYSTIYGDTMTILGFTDTCFS